jgi:hypothetical protein
MRRRKLVTSLLIAAVVIAALAAPAFAIFGALVARVAAGVPALITQEWHSVVPAIQASVRTHEATLAHALHGSDVSTAAGAVGHLLVLAAPVLALAVVLLLVAAWSIGRRGRAST